MRGVPAGSSLSSATMTSSSLAVELGAHDLVAADILDPADGDRHALAGGQPDEFRADAESRSWPAGAP